MDHHFPFGVNRQLFPDGCGAHRAESDAARRNPTNETNADAGNYDVDILRETLRNLIPDDSDDDVSDPHHTMESDDCASATMNMTRGSTDSGEGSVTSPGWTTSASKVALVRNVDASISQEQLLRVFFPHGAVKVHLITDTATARRGAVVRFIVPDCADMAADKLNNFVPAGHMQPLVVTVGHVPEGMENTEEAQRAVFSNPPSLRVQGELKLRKCHDDCRELELLLLSNPPFAGDQPQVAPGLAARSSAIATTLEHASCLEHHAHIIVERIGGMGTERTAVEPAVAAIKRLEPTTRAQLGQFLPKLTLRVIMDHQGEARHTRLAAAELFGSLFAMNIVGGSVYGAATRLLSSPTLHPSTVEVIQRFVRTWELQQDGSTLHRMEAEALGYQSCLKEAAKMWRFSSSGPSGMSTPVKEVESVGHLTPHPSPEKPELLARRGQTVTVSPLQQLHQSRTGLRVDPAAPVPSELTEVRLRTVYVSRIPPNMGESDLRTLLLRCGELAKVRITTGHTHRGSYGFVEYCCQSSARQLVQLDKQIVVGGYCIRCMEAKSPIHDQDPRDATFDAFGTMTRPCRFGLVDTEVAQSEIRISLAGEDHVRVGNVGPAGHLSAFALQAGMPLSMKPMSAGAMPFMPSQFTAQDTTSSDGASHRSSSNPNSFMVSSS